MPTASPKPQGQLCYPYGTTSNDEEILSGVLNALHHNSGVPQDRVRVEIRRGRAVLSGVVEQDYERTLAEQIAATAPGVQEVINEIRLAS
jgi:osmotically-inducible protein OsmY